jgi:hypothetical protein
LTAWLQDVANNRINNSTKTFEYFFINSSLN